MPRNNAFLTGTGLHLAYWHWPQYVEQQTRTTSHPSVDRGLGAMIWPGSGLDGVTAGSLAHSFPGERQADIWLGLGFAIAFLADLYDVKSKGAMLPNSGPMGPYLRQGIAFGAFQRSRFQPDDEQLDEICRQTAGEPAAALVRRSRNTFAKWE